jgi:hypothetical protein
VNDETDIRASKLGSEVHVEERLESSRTAPPKLLSALLTCLNH